MYTLISFGLFVIVCLVATFVPTPKEEAAEVPEVEPPKKRRQVVKSYTRAV